MTDNKENITTIRTLLEAYYSGSLDAAGEVRLRQLLEETAPLPADLEEERQLMRLTSEALLSMLDEEDVPEGLEDTLRADIHRRAVAAGRRKWRRWLYSGVAAAVAAVMVTVAVIAPRDGNTEKPLTAQTQQTSAPAPAPAQSQASPTQPNMIASAETSSTVPAFSQAAPKAARKASRIETAQPLPRQEEALTAETTPSLTDEETQQMMLLGEELAQVRQLMLANNQEIESEFSTTIDEAGISRSACMTEVFASGGRHTDGPDNQEYLNP